MQILDSSDKFYPIKPEVHPGVAGTLATPARRRKNLA
jgi:hypothetical protein